ncbi:hypothetical protein AAFF_G00412870 [Aldrovandia affinis]|uniref:TIR domain-containing protein n=1 Tax=Aldrovandia affinis TaxID=143900 RepID=A0AAD7SB21_9TELE|nr:hypothetical protein AAFF_G00412870 [Aldrovandia affinis]
MWPAWDSSSVPFCHFASLRGAGCQAVTAVTDNAELWYRHTAAFAGGEMAPHVMLSYHWDDQALVRRVYDRLKEDGIPLWMDVEGGVSGNINDAMAAGVEEAAVICPFMTPAYQASRSGKKELNYADTRGVTVVPVMLAKNWEASEWLGLITAGLVWIDFRNAGKSDDHFEKCVKSLEYEIMFAVGNLLNVEEDPPADVNDTPTETRRPAIKRKPGRGFRHALTGLYLWESGEQKFHPDSDTRNSVELHHSPEDNGYWEEIKGDGCKRYRNVITHGYLGYDPNGNYAHTKATPHWAGEWLLIVDETDDSTERAVVMKNKHSQTYLAVHHGTLVGLKSYSESCRWYLE